MEYDETEGVSYFTMAWSLIASVGWYVVGLLVALWYTSPYIQEKYKSWKLKRDEREYAAKYHKDIDLVKERLSEVEASRQRMQEEYQRRALLAQEKEEERKEKKRQERAALLDGTSSGKKLGKRDEEASSSSESKSKSLKPEYNPLSGDGARGYRPPKRSCCGKGGCG